jgi:hypothetical protein
MKTTKQWTVSRDSSGFPAAICLDGCPMIELQLGSQITALNIGAILRLINAAWNLPARAAKSKRAK